MKTKNEKRIKTLFPFKTKIECPFQPMDCRKLYLNVVSIVIKRKTSS